MKLLVTGAASFVGANIIRTYSNLCLRGFLTVIDDISERIIQLPCG